MDFIGNSSKTSQKFPDHCPGCWKKNANFDFDESCRSAFDEIKSILVKAPIMATPDLNKEFEIMCDANNYTMGAVLGQRTKKISGLYTMPAKPSMRQRKTTLPQRRRC